MASDIVRHQRWALGLFWGLIGVCGVLAVACMCLALGEVGQPWSGFAVNTFGSVQEESNTTLVYFDQVVAVNGQRVARGVELRTYLQRVPLGSPVTYRIVRGAQTLEVTVPLQSRSWAQLLVEAGIPLLAGLGQLCLGALVFRLRPGTRCSWVFLGFCLAWFGLFVTFFDFASTYVLTDLFLFCWFLTSALFVHLAFVFPEERPILRRYPRLPVLFYVPSLGLWLVDELCFYRVLNPWLGQTLAVIYAVYWGTALLCLLVSLAHTALRAPSPVARCRAVTVLFGFAAGFIFPMGAQIATMLLRVNLPLACFWPLTLLLPLSMTYAILRYNLFDVGMLVRRSLTYGSLTVAVIALYLVGLWFSNSFFQRWPLTQAHGFQVFFGVMVLLGLNPLRTHLQEMLDRLFFRTRYDFRQTIEALSGDLTALLDLDAIASRIVTTVVQTLQVTRVALFLEDGQGAYSPVQVVGEATEQLSRVRPTRDNPVVALIARQRRGVSRYDLEANPALAVRAPGAAAALQHLGVSLAFPILFKEEVIGLLALGTKRSGAIFTEADLELLRTLTNQSAVAMANARAYRALEETNAALRAALRKVETLEHVKTHLGKFVPAVVRQIVERDPTAPALDKREQDVTVLFLDMAGYTSLSESLEQEQMNYLVERYFSSFLDDIYANHGDINETAGDGLMVIFQDEDACAHARAAVRTALAIRAATQRINAELALVYAPVTVNMGINSGTAAVGSTRFESATGTRWTFTASGPVTNLAARLGAYATGGAIYVGPETARRVGEAVQLRPLGLQAFKNVREPVAVYAVLTEETTASVAQA